MFITADGCYAYFNADSVESCRLAFMHLKEYLREEGPFEEVALTLLLECTPTSNLGLKCAIFLAGSLPADLSAL